MSPRGLGGRSGPDFPQMVREVFGRMGSRLYVGNLPFSADEQQVRELFERNNREVNEVKLITDRDTGRPRGFGFVDWMVQTIRKGPMSSG